MRQLTSTEVYANSWMTVREDAVARDDGSQGIYGVVDKPHYALIVPCQDGGVHLVEQFRYPVGARCWEFPQGTAPDRATSPPTELAARELAEETGLRAGTMTPIGSLQVAPGMSSQRGTVFVATDLHQEPPTREHEEQDMRAAWVHRDEFDRMVRAGEIADSQSLAAYALLLLRERVG